MLRWFNLKLCSVFMFLLFLCLIFREGLRLFVDDREEDSGSLAGFTFSLPLESGNDPVLHVGGAPNSLSPGAAPFVGCLKDFAFNFE